MSDLHFLCPACRHSLLVDARGMGHTSTCAHCSEPFAVPVLASDSVEFEERSYFAGLRGEEEKVRADLEALQKSIAPGELTARERLRTTGDELTQAYRQLADVREQLTAASQHEEEAERLRHETAGQTSRLEELQKRLTTAERDTLAARDSGPKLAHAEEELAMAGARQIDLEKQLREANQSLDGLSRKLRTARTAEEELRARAADHEAALALLTGEARSASTERDELRTRSKELADRLAAVTASDATARAESAKARESMVTLNQNVHALTNERDALESALKDLRTRHSGLSDYVATLEVNEQLSRVAVSSTAEVAASPRRERPRDFIQNATAVPA